MWADHQLERSISGGLSKDGGVYGLPLHVITTVQLDIAVPMGLIRMHGAAELSQSDLIQSCYFL